ncbi:methyltransferase domain-containing protein, partial [bacterium]|nr:methyltransferase domain-containing protein [bacterium]
EETNFHERKRRAATFRLISEILAKQTKSPTALDVGCGTGKVSLLLAESGFDVTSLDLSIEMLLAFRQKISGRKLNVRPKIVCADMFHFLENCGSKFDLIVFCGTLHHVTNVPKALELAAKRLTEGGIILITHEPLKQAISSKLRFAMHRAAATLDEAIYRRYLRKFPDEAKDIDYSTSDIQRQFGGIDPEQVLSVLEANGLSIIRLDKYCARRYGALCIIANSLIRSQNTFQIIARRGGQTD